MAKRINEKGIVVEAIPTAPEGKQLTLASEAVATEINSSALALDNTDLCAVEPLKPSDTACEPAPGGATEIKKNEAALGEAVALGTALAEGAAKANVQPDPFMEEPHCELELNSEVEKSMKSLRDRADKAKAIGEKLDSKMLRLHTAMEFLDYHVYYLVHSRTTAEKFIKKAELLSPAFSSPLEGDPSRALVNLDLDRITQQGSDLVTATPSMEELRPMFELLRTIKIGETPKNDFAKRFSSLVIDKISKWSDVGKIESKQEFQGKSFDTVDKLQGTYLGNLDDLNQKYVNNLKESISTFKQKVNDYNSSNSVTVSGDPYAIDVNNETLSGYFQTYVSGVNSLNKTYVSKLDKLNSDLYADLSAQFPIMAKTLSNDVVLPQKRSYSLPVSGASESGLMKSLLAELRKQFTPSAAQAAQYVKIKNDSFKAVYDSTFFPTYDRNCLNMKYLAMRISQFKLLEDDPDMFHRMTLFAETIRVEYDDIVYYYNNTDSEVVIEEFETELSKKTVCGKPLLVKDSTPISQAEDVNLKSYSLDPNGSDVTKLKYWRKFATVLNSVGILPNNWTIGLLVPNPSGIARIPLPIVWTPIFAAHTPTRIYVLWITVNGVVVSPTLFEWRLLPTEQYATYHKVLFRGANALIKIDTGVKSTAKAVHGIDVNPKVTAAAPLEKDDIPIPERVSLKNPLFLLYVQKWLDACKPFMGFP